MATLRRITAALLLVAPAALSAQQPAMSNQQPSQPPSASIPYSIYVSSESGDIVTRIEVGESGWRKVREIPVGVMPTDPDGPHNVAVSPDGRFWYVSIAHGAPFGSVWKFATGADTLIGRVAVGMFPTTIGLSPEGDWAYVPNSDFHGDRGQQNTVAVIYTPDLTRLTEIPACDMPHGSRYNQSGSAVYIACMMSDELLQIDPGSFQITRRIPLGSGHPMSMAEHNAMEARPGAASSTMAGQNPDCLTTYVSVSPDDRLVYLACSHSNEVQVRDARTLDLVRRLATGTGAYNVEPSADGRWLAVTNKKNQSVSIFNTQTWAEAARVATTKRIPHGVVFSPDGRYLFVTQESVGSDPGAIDAIDLGTMQRVATMAIPLQPTALAIWRGRLP